jgi:4-aminobutyrate aminotransferase
MPFLNYQSPKFGRTGETLINRDRMVMFGANTRSRELPLVVESGNGCRLKDVDGNEFLDFGAGYAVCSTGHCPDTVITALTEQAKKLIHISGTDFYYSVQTELAEELVRLVPGHFNKRVCFTNSGAETMEAAFKLTRYYTRRPRVISFIGAFHGRTFAGMSLSGSKKIQKSHYAPLIPDVVHTFYPYCFRCPINLEYPGCKKRLPEYDGIPMLPCVAFLTDVVFEQLVDPEDVGALFVEPIQGEGGYIVPPDEFHPLLRAITKKYEIPYVADEIQTGLGRTGKMFAMEHWGVEPDVVCIAKALASGLPIGAVVGRAELMDAEVDSQAWRQYSHGTTFGGNPVVAAAALATLKILKSGLVDNAAKLGSYMIGKLTEMKERHRIIGDVRGKGLMIGIELVKDKATKEKFPKALTEDGKGITQVVTGSCFKKGLVVLGCGFNSIRLSPPLIITKDEADTGLAIIEAVIAEIEKEV